MLRAWERDSGIQRFLQFTRFCWQSPALRFDLLSRKSLPREKTHRLQTSRIRCARPRKGDCHVVLELAPLDYNAWERGREQNVANRACVAPTAPPAGDARRPHGAGDAHG